MRPTRTFRGLAVVFAVAASLLAVTAAPAASTHVALGCSWQAAGSDAFSSLGALAPVSGARGDDAREPALNETADEVPAAEQGKGGRAFKATVPVYVHVLSPDGVVGNVSTEAIDDQIAVLNMTFGGFEGGFATGFRFKLAGVDRTVNADWYDMAPGSKDERDAKKALRQGGADALNMYLGTANLYLGWAYFPSTYKTRPYLDGIVIDWESLLGTSTRYAGRYDQGETATHEAGHWLGLYHVFQGGCNAKGDYVDDTPPQLVATRGCPVGQDSCSEPGLDSIHNYMDYSYDTCYTEFSADQSARMQDQWLYYRVGN